MTESNCHYLITKQVFYHLTNRANWRKDSRIELYALSHTFCFQDRAGPSPVNLPWLADSNRLELLPFPVDRFSKPVCVPRTAIYKLVSMVRFERTASWLQIRPSTRLTLHRDKIGGGRGNRILLDKMLARQLRSPLLPPIVWLRVWGSNSPNHWLTVRSLHHAWISRNRFGAVDGNRTHLSLADNELPSQRATTAYWYSRRVSIPLLHLERVAS